MGMMEISTDGEEMMREREQPGAGFELHNLSASGNSYWD
jgi:hypothetical protein